MSKGEKKKNKKPRDRQRSKGFKNEEEIKKEKTKRNRIIGIVIVVVVVILVIAFIFFSKLIEEGPPVTKWWSYESSCIGAEVTDVTKVRDATGWNITVHLLLEKEYYNLTVRYIIDWDDGNHTDDTFRINQPPGFVFIGDQEFTPHFPSDAEPSKVHIVVSDCD